MGDEDFYLLATNEIDENNTDKAIYAKAKALAEGDELKTRYLYINLRVENLNKSKVVEKPLEVLPSSASNAGMEANGIGHSTAPNDKDPMSLAEAFWGYGVIGGAIVGFALGAVAQSLSVGGVGWVLIPLALLMIWTIAVNSRIWLEATRYRGPRLWAALAKIWVVWVYILAVLVSIGFMGSLIE